MTFRSWFALALLSCTGCLVLPTEDQHPVAKPAATPTATISGPVTPDYVTPSNAQQVAESLRQEMDRAGNE